MGVSIILAVERGGKTIPICRTRRREVAREVGQAALNDVRVVAGAETDETMAALLAQEADRLAKALHTLGLSDGGGQ